MLDLFYTTKFKKDYKRILKRNINPKKLELVIKLLMIEQPLPDRCRDHSLTGNYARHRECHIEPDWLLIYRVTENQLRLERTGSHADLF